MKNLYHISLCIILILFTHRASAQGANQQKVITKSITLQTTEEDYTIDEIAKFDTYVKKHSMAIPGTNGEVLVSFTTEKNGTLTHIRVAKSLSNTADAEAVRLVKAYPRWKPNTVGGKPQSSTMTVPIRFGKK